MTVIAFSLDCLCCEIEGGDTYSYSIRRPLYGPSDRVRFSSASAASSDVCSCAQSGQNPHVRFLERSAEDAITARIGDLAQVGVIRRLLGVNKMDLAATDNAFDSCHHGSLPLQTQNPDLVTYRSNESVSALSCVQRSSNEYWLPSAKLNLSSLEVLTSFAE